MATTAEVASLLRRHHYLGPAERGFAFADRNGVLVFSNPSSRRLPQRQWFELTRWCILPGAEQYAGSRQWSVVAAWLRRYFPDVSTVVSYSDPAQGHTGALYRACNWLWAPTWLRLRPPPSGHGKWSEGGRAEAVKDRWVYCLTRDEARPGILAVKDESIMGRTPWASYVEPKWKLRHPVGGGGAFKRWIALAASSPHYAEKGD